jgi:hypothetical protein
MNSTPAGSLRAVFPMPEAERRRSVVWMAWRCRDLTACLHTQLLEDSDAAT